jgi:hypothetical protein
MDGINEFDYLHARRKWASNILQGFLIGTICNIIFALIDVAVGKAPLC